MASEDFISLPQEYDQKIIDNKGDMIEAAANRKHLFVRTLARHENNDLDAMYPVETISLSLCDTLRFIMFIARVAQFPDALDEKTKEILHSIEIIARHEIGQHNSMA